jgi:hypothetical protein
MNARQLYEPNKCRQAARHLLTEVNSLINKAERTTDDSERHKLYLQAMGISQQAYHLLGKAKEINEKTRFRAAKN